jgi:glyoxylase-like metal-dependent hydrolase (beta-lactamase superfamily II)
MVAILQLRTEPGMHHSRPTLALALTFLAHPLAAQDPNLTMRIQPVAPRFQLITGYYNGNILVFQGEAGLLLVDGQSTRRVTQADSALRTVTALPVKLLVSTHYHGDHLEGNAHWKQQGARLIAQAQLVEEAKKDTTIAEREWHRPAASPDMLPDQTFTDSTSFDFEGEPVVLLHPVAAHTRGDAIIWFPRANVIHTGDILEREAPPFIDWWAGGRFDGMIAACDRILAMINNTTVVVPGHGTPTDKAGLARYREMLVTARDRIAPRVAAGDTDEAIVAARPLREYETDLGGERRAGQLITQITYGMRRAFKAGPS